MTLIRPEIIRGIDLLNEKRPGWTNSINLDTLEMGNVLTCIIGQISDVPIGYGTYLATVGELAGYETSGEGNTLHQDWAREELGIAYGFQSNEGYFDLTTEWIIAIRMLRQWGYVPAYRCQEA